MAAAPAPALAPPLAAPERPVSASGDHPHDRRFVRGILVTGASQLVSHGQNFLLVVLFVRLAGATSFGAWTSVLIATTLLSVFAQANLQASAVRFATGEAPERAARNVRDLLTLTAALGAVGIALTAALAGPIAAVAREPGLVPLLRLGAPVVGLHAVTMVAYSCLVAAHRNEMLALWGAALSSLDVAAVAAGLLLSGSLEAVVLLYVGSKVVHAGVLALIVLRVYGPAGARAVPLHRYLAYALPALPAAVAMWALTSADRLLLSAYHGVTTLGVYSAVTAMVGVLAFMAAPLYVVLFPRMVDLWKAGDVPKTERYLSHSLHYLLVLIVPAAVGLLLVGDHLLAMLVTPQVLVAAYSGVPWIVAAAVLWALANPFLALLKVVDRTRALGAVWVLAAALIVALGAVLVPPLGLVGAGVARTAGLSVALVALVFLARRHLRVVVDAAILLRVAGATILMAFAVSAVPVTGFARLVAVSALGACVYVAALFVLERFAPPERRLLLPFLWPAFWLRGAR